MKRSRIKIGVLTDMLHELYQAGIWQGIVAQAEKQNVDLMTFVGSSSRGLEHFDARNGQWVAADYDFVVEVATRNQVDGMIVLTSPIASIYGAPYVEKLCGRIGTIPLVCISDRVPGCHSVLVDNAGGIEEAVEHLVAVHNLRNIAFIKGPESNNEANARFEAYRRGLESNHLTFRPELVFEGGFSERFGTDAIAYWLDHQIDFDGVIAVNDYVAHGGMAELARRGVLVPTDVAVIGFDDVTESARTIPSLSSIRQPLHQLGEAAVDSILAQLGVLQAPADVVLATQMVYRRSCGCFSDAVLESKATPQQIDGLTADEVVAHLWQTSLQMVRRDDAAYPGDTALKGIMDNLVGSLVWDVQHPVIRHIFLNELDMLLHRVERYGDVFAIAFALLRDLTVYVASLFKKPDELGEANNLLQQAGTFVREQFAGRMNRARDTEDAFLHHVRLVNRRIIRSVSYAQLVQCIEEEFPILGIQSFSLWEFTEPVDTRNWTVPHQAKLINAYRLKGETEMRAFLPDKPLPIELIPPMIQCDQCKSNHIFMPLLFGEQYVGFAVYEYSSLAPLYLYDELRDHLTSALVGCRLQQQQNIPVEADEKPARQ